MVCFPSVIFGLIINTHILLRRFLMTTLLVVAVYPGQPAQLAAGDLPTSLIGHPFIFDFLKMICLE